MKTSVNLSKILTPEELQWFGQWLSKSQMREGIKSHSGSVSFGDLQRLGGGAQPGGRRVASDGDLWENPSAEETRNSIEGLNRRLASYDDQMRKQPITKSPATFRRSRWNQAGIRCATRSRDRRPSR